MTYDLDLTSYSALSFDCYGTLIDWESGLGSVLVPWAREQGLDLTDEGLLLAYSGNEAAVQAETPEALYPDVLATAFRRTGEASIARSAMSGRRGWPGRSRTGRHSPTRQTLWPACPGTTS